MRRLIILLSFTSFMFVGTGPVHAGTPGQQWYYDNDGNGKPDTYFEDRNGDDRIDRVIGDKNENRIAQVWLDDNDGVNCYEFATFDQNENGKIEAQGTDDDCDGNWDWKWLDQDEDKCDDRQHCQQVGGNHGPDRAQYNDPNSQGAGPWTKDSPDPDGDGWQGGDDHYPHDPTRH